MRKLLLLLAFMGQAHALSIELGKDEPVRAPICTTKADALNIAKAAVSKGDEEAALVFSKLDECDIFSLVVKPLRVIYTGTQTNGTVIRVVEIEVSLASGHKRNFWMITSDVQIVGLLNT